MNAAQTNNLPLAATQSSLARQLQNAIACLDSHGVEYNYGAVANSYGHHAASAEPESGQARHARRYA